MNSTPPELDSSPAEGPTDFASLMVSAVSAQPKPKAPDATDFASLKRATVEAPAPFVRRSLTDYVIDVATPVLIFVLVYVVVLFLLDVRFIYTEVFDRNLRFMSFFFLVGVVALNRLVARDGANESVIYMLALTAAVAMYTLVSTTWYEVDSVAQGIMNENLWTAAGFNMLVAAFIWWVTNRLVHECCVDENRTAGDIGILRGTAQRVQGAFRRDPDAARARARKWTADAARAEVLGTQYDLKPFDPLEDARPPERKPAPARRSAADRLGRRHPGISIFLFSGPVMVIFALGLPVVRNAGPGWVMKGMVYMGIYSCCALMLLMLTSLGGLRQYFRVRGISMPGRIGVFWAGLGTFMVLLVLVAALQFPLPPLPPMAYVAEHRTDPWQHDWFTMELVDPGTMPEETILATQRAVDAVGKAVLAVFALFLAYAVLRALGVVAARIARNRDRYPRWVRRLFDLIDRALQALLRVPSLPSRRPRRRISPAVAASARFSSSLADPAMRGRMSVQDHVQHAYDALCALAYDMGMPRRADETPYEFIDRFPEELAGIAAEARELTGIYVLAAYSPAVLDEKILDRLRKFWMTYHRVRRRYVR